MNMSQAIARQQENGKLILIFPNLAALGEIPTGELKIVGFWRIGRNQYKRGGVDADLIDNLPEADLLDPKQCQEYLDLMNAYEEHFS